MADRTADLMEHYLKLRDHLQTIYDMTHEVNDHYLRDYIRREVREALGKNEIVTPTAPAQTASVRDEV